MCGIVGSFSKRPFLENLERNLVRGNYAWSFMRINYVTYDHFLIQGFGIPSFDDISKEFKYDVSTYFYVGHVLAPTGIIDKEKNYKRLHPARISAQCFLYHNGIFLPKTIENLNNQLNSHFTWDTELFLNYLDANSEKFPQILDDIEGSFACIYIKKHYFINIFRNKVSPLYIDDKGTFSSVWFENSFDLEPNYVFKLNPRIKKFEKYAEFNNKHDPYNI